MLLNISNLFLILSIAFFSGCSGKYNYTHKSYHATTVKGANYTHKNNKRKQITYKGKYKNHNNTNIKDSKEMHRATMRPYEVFGKKYYPTIAHIGDDFNGIASWYGPNFNAKKTSNGEIYDMYALTAAHKTLPMNTIVKVTNLANGKTTIVRINDRGPFVGTRIIDLSNKAAHQLDMIKKGTANIRLTVIGFGGKIAKTLREKKEIGITANYFIQVGVFSKLEGAKNTRRKFKMILDDKYKVIFRKDVIDGLKMTRVWISGFRSEQEAYDFKKSNDLNGAMIIAE